MHKFINVCRTHLGRFFVDVLMSMLLFVKLLINSFDILGCFLSTVLGLIPRIYIYPVYQNMFL